MPNYDEILVTFLFASFLIWDYFAGVYNNQQRKKGDWLVDAISFGQLAILKPLVMLLAFYMAFFLLPQLENVFVDIPFWLGFVIVFLPDDFSHYWIHRLAHTHQSIWPLHRTHHTPTVYQTSIAFRENWLWFIVMPGFWWHGLMIYFGLIEQVILTSAIVGAHNVWLHNSSTKDRFLYKNKYTRFPMKLVEYVLNTPSLHRGHHGLGKNGVPFGNYAQTLFIWDVIFGTAKFMRDTIPEHYAVSNKEIMQQPWYFHLWWPLVKKTF